MATGFLRAIAADRKIGMVRQRRKEIKRPAIRWRSHLCPVFFHEDRPFARRRRALRQRDRIRTWRKIWKPDVIPVLRSVLSPRNATRRPSNRANAKALAASPVGAKPNNTNRHLMAPTPLPEAFNRDISMSTRHRANGCGRIRGQLARSYAR
jgi:hypothetical protein